MGSVVHQTHNTNLYDKDGVQVKPMGDPISGSLDLGFCVFALAVLFWLSLDTRRFLKIVFWRAKPMPRATVVLVRIMATCCAFGLIIVLVVHFLGKGVRP